MKEYSVYLKEEVPYTVINEKFNREKNCWEDVEETKMIKYRTFYSLPAAKKFIKEHLDVYQSSCITKIYANGDWENCGEIKLSGRNAIQMNNMTTKQY